MADRLDKRQRRRDHVLTEFGTTSCPVENVRADVDDGVCSACGSTVSTRLGDSEQI